MRSMIAYSRKFALAPTVSVTAAGSDASHCVNALYAMLFVFRSLRSAPRTELLSA
jgi:hypothetical protein